MLQQSKHLALLGLIVVFFTLFVIGACTQARVETLPTGTPTQIVNPNAQNTPETNDVDLMKKPLVTHIYTADPSAHVFEGKLYIYPSHDLDHNNAPTTTQASQASSIASLIEIPCM